MTPSVRFVLYITRDGAMQRERGETGTEGKGVPPDVPEYTDNENRNDGSTHANGSKTAPDKSKVKRQLYDRSASTQIKPSGLYYDVPDNPPIHLATMFGFQIAMTNIFSCVNMAVIVSKFICSDQEFAASLYSTTSVMSGICTILQTSLGVRLPVFQGPSILFTLPYMNAATEPAWGCQSEITDFNSSLLTNGTISQSREQPWLTQWNKIQGSLMAASGLQIVIGAFGLGGLLLRAMGPISITCLILLLGLSIQSLISVVAEIHWGMSCLNIVIIIVISQYVNRYNVPMPTWSRRGGFKFVPFPLFELFPVLLSVIIGWVISYIFTVCGLFPDDSSVLQYQARTDFAIDSVRNAPVFTVPYPGQYGAPSIKLSYFVMIAVVVLASILESVGDYVQTTGPSRVAVPPPHAINRGIIMEGLGSFLSGAMGAGHATTSYSNTIGMIGITKVASRRVFNIAGLIMILMGVCGKLGAVFVAIPKPVLVGPIFIAISLLVGAALSNLKAVDLWSSRSQGVLGIAIMAGTVFPTWLQQHPGTFKTGSEELDQTITAFLGMPLVVGVIVAMFLDVTIPGTSRKQASVDMDADDTTQPGDVTVGRTVSQDMSIYEIPLVGRWLSGLRLARYVPFLPDPCATAARLKPINTITLETIREIKD